jgi:hypothetical protein
MICVFRAAMDRDDKVDWKLYNISWELEAIAQDGQRCEAREMDRRTRQKKCKTSRTDMGTQRVKGFNFKIFEI